MSDQAVILQPDPAAQAKLTQLLTRLQSELGQGAQEAVSWTAYYVARSMGASMKVAPKTRKLIANDNSDPKHPATRWQGYVWKWKRDGARRRVWIHATADPDTFTRIKRRTLARQSWLWMLGDMGRGGGTSLLKRPPGVSTVTKQGGLNPSVTLANKLRYVLSAARTGGKHAVDTAFSRGATAGLRYLDNRLKKAMAR